MSAAAAPIADREARPWHAGAPSPPEYRAVDRARFEAEIVPAGRPAILRGLVSDWPVVRAARNSADALAAWLRAHATDAAGEAWFGPPDMSGRFGFTDAFDGHNHDRRRATLDQLLDLILRQRGVAAPWSVYAGALPVARHLPDFLDGNPMPLLDPARRMLVSLWLGNRTSTAAHWDLPQNLACVVAGRRRFTLFPIDQVANLYVGPLDRTLAGQPSSLVDIDAPDLGRFPRFAEAMAAAEVAELAPGDALYLPSLWWHAVRGLDEVGAMVNFWWRDAPAGTGTPLAALFHALLTLGPVPQREKEAWRALFEHYVFGGGAAATDHLPEQAQGVLGPRTPETDAALRRLVARGLD